MDGDKFYERWMALQPDAPLSEQAVANLDRFDHKDWAKIHGELVDLATATDDLAQVVETGRPLMADAFWSFFKSSPKLAKPEQMQPLNVLNLTVMEQVVDLNQWHELRRYTKGDDVASGMACVEIEPDLESIADRTRLQQEQAEEFQAKLDALREAQTEKLDADQMYEQMLAEEIPSDDEDRQALLAALAQHAEEMAEAMGDAEAAATVAGEALEEGLEGAVLATRKIIAAALGRAAQQLREMAEATAAWGVEPGEWQHMDAQERLALAKRLHNPRLEKIAEKFGPMHWMAETEQERKVEFARSEVVDVTMGDDISSVLATELVRLRDPRQKTLFYRDLVEGQLLEYRLEGKERVGKGGIIMLEDGSGSMRIPDPNKELWAKAFMLCLMHIARKQGRAFYLVHFGSPDEYKVLSFESPSDFTTDRIIEAAELFFNGGTDFETPFNVAIEHLQAQHRAKGYVEGDIVMVTDGLCNVSPRWDAWYREEQARLKFATYGVLIGGMHKQAEPLYGLCDGKVCTVQDLVSGGDVRDVFRGV